MFGDRRACDKTCVKLMCAQVCDETYVVLIVCAQVCVSPWLLGDAFYCRLVCDVRAEPTLKRLLVPYDDVCELLRVDDV